MHWMKTFTKTSHAMLLGLALLLTADSAMAECTYTIKGKLAVQHQLSELVTAYGTSPLKGVKVQISGKAKVMGVWGWYAVWDEVTTNSLGEFSLTQSKACYDHRYKIEVKFQGDDLEVRHETSTSSTTKVKWYLIFEDETVDHGPGTLDVGTRTFSSGAPRELSLKEARDHADIWVAYQKAIEKINGYGPDRAFTSQIRVKFPHNSDVVSDTVEASYANPATQVIYIFESHFNIGTLYHELMHIWAYQHVSGELGLAWELMQNGSTHGLVDEPWVAFHEGFAEYGSDKLQELIFGESARLPYNRERLTRGISGTPLTSINLVQRHDMGWWSAFHIMTTASLGNYTFKTAWTGGTAYTPSYIVPREQTPIVYSCNPPSLTFAQVLRVFVANSTAGYPNNLTQDEMLVARFYDRAADILTNLSLADSDSFLDLLNPAGTTQPLNEFCSPIIIAPFP